jgi:hypothetical protein
VKKKTKNKILSYSKIVASVYVLSTESLGKRGTRECLNNEILGRSMKFQEKKKKRSLKP